jgi:putative transposase
MTCGHSRLLALDRVALHTLTGRVVCRLLPGHRHHPLLVDPAWTIGGADLVWHDGAYFLHGTQTRVAPATAGSGGVLGVDLGMVQLATDRDGASFTGAKVTGMRHYFATRRAVLHRVGTKSARRRLTPITRRESRSQREVNHCISTALVVQAAMATTALAMEDRTGINARAPVRVAARSWRMGWAFCHRKTGVRDTAALLGVPVIQVDPRNTSRTWSACGQCAQANRQSQASFLCRRCGFATNADCNAAVTIAYRAAVNQPMVSDATHRSHRLSSVRVVAPGTRPHALAVGR